MEEKSYLRETPLDMLLYMVEKLQATTSRIIKEGILREFAKEPLCIEVLKFLFDPMIVTGISTKKIEKMLVTSVPENYDAGNLVALLEYLKYFNTGRDVDIARAQSFILSKPEVYREMLKKIVTKDLKLGLDCTTLNKVYGKGFIKTFDVMLADNYFDNQTYADGKMMVLTQKLDGIRCVAFYYSTGEVKFYTRQGQDYGSLPQVEEEIRKLRSGYVYDGELIAKAEKYVESDDEFALFSDSDSGELFRQTASVAMRDGVKTGLCHHIFDMIPMEEFSEGRSKESALVRKERLTQCISAAPNTYWIENVEVLAVTSNPKEVEKWHNYATEKGWEGIMVNIADAPYQCKRTKDLLKVKKFISVDCRVEDTFEGTGKYAGMLGGIRVKFKYKDQEYTCDCGSGFNDEERKKYWKDYKPKLLHHAGDLVGNDIAEEPYEAKEDIYEDINFVDLTGKVVELKCFEISRNKEGTYSLRFPVWLNRIREDKTEL